LSRINKRLGQSKPQIKNENILVIKPNTNSEGIWYFKNITERGFSEPTYSVVEQYWID